MKISFDLRFAHLPGGGRVYAWKLLRTLIKQYPQIEWKLYYNPWSQPQNEILLKLRQKHSSGKEQYRWQIQPVHSACLTLRQHIEFLRFRDDADVYHYLHFDMPLGIRTRSPLMTIHDLYPLTVPGYCSKAKRAYFLHIIRQNTRKASKVIAVSEHTKKDILEWFNIPEQKIVVIPQSQATDFQPIHDQAILETAKQKHELPQCFIFVTGNHKPHKNLSRLIQAFALLPKELREQFPLVLTGAVTKDTNKLIAQAEALGINNQVIFLGWTEELDLPALYNLASLVVLPSLYEGFGLAPLEAMACGTPVACAMAGSTPEVVGSASRLFDPYNINEMSQTIKLSLENDIDDEQLIAQCLQQAAKFSEQKTAQQTFETYQTVAQTTK